MERIKLGDESSSLVIEVTPDDLRSIANKLEARSKVSAKGSSIIIPISNSVSFLYNVPMVEKTIFSTHRDSRITDSSQVQ